ncbi:kinetochore protein Spc24 [Antennarius striatus]|uniref:kinetochore protein Spc24 n=1 Tax=Antennarius striatus TaxID=241820 RepID=UPI0035B478D2
MSQGHKFQDLEETGEALVAFINSSQPEKLGQVKGEQRALFDQHIETKNTVTQILKDVAQTEESVGQRLLIMEEQKKQKETELRDVEEQLRQYTAKSQITDSELQFLQRELESLRNTEHDLQTLQNEVDEDTTEVIPSAVYVAQVYYLITKIKWEYDTPPNILKGVHYGADLATPVNIDTYVRSRSDISDHLWNFVSTQWEQ